jgi:hypothetical protein
MSSEKAAKKKRRAAFLQGVQDQLDNPKTPEVRFHYQRLRSLGHSDSNARELIATLLAFFVWHTFRGDGYTYADYVAELERLPEIDWDERDEVDA